MNSLNTNKSSYLSETNQKDILKGQKILAAIYMVTNHLPETDAVRVQLRSLATSFVCASFTDMKEELSRIELVLGGAVFAGLISEKNSSVIIYEATHFSKERFSGHTSSDIDALFADSQEQSDKRHVVLKDNKKTSMSTILLSSNRPTPSVSHTKNLEIKIDNKSARQDTILSFINDRKSAVIKDIVSLFPDVSEKTIQRELNTLIDTGRITKRGSKRWSIYMAVNSLL